MITAAAGDGSVKLPLTLLIDTGTSGAAEIFAAALSGNNRADLIGEHTIGRAGAAEAREAARRRGFWLTTT